MKKIFHFIFLYGILACVLLSSAGVDARQLSASDNNGQQIGMQQRLLLARSFVSKMKSSLTRADAYLFAADIVEEKNILPEGGTLLLEPVLADNLRIEGVIYGVVHNKRILLSLRDISDVFQIPISVDAEDGKAEGWYIRENKTFSLDLAGRIVRTDKGEFNISDDVIIENDDILVPLNEFGRWIDFEFKPEISRQELHITSSELLPIQERYNRRKGKGESRRQLEPVLPLGGKGYQESDVPAVDVATRSTYRKNGSEDEGLKNHNATIKTVGDLGHGTFTTQSQLNNRDQVTSVRASYKQESLDADLLGVLGARRFDVGDVSTARIPLGGQVSQELGVRITNTDSLRTFSTPTTAISGTAFPGWDVELYRNNQRIAFREVGDDGFYSFDNVNLFLANNNFRLVFYGPQGEVREENVFVPVNPTSLSRGGGVYDVSVSLDRKNTYNKKISNYKDPDEGSLNVSAFFEKSIMDGTSLSAGFRSSEKQGERDFVGNTGFSTTVLQTLVNGGVAVDDEGEAAAELTLRRDFGDHEVRDALSWRGENFDTQAGGSQNAIGTFKNDLNITGPIPFSIGFRPVYNTSVSYSENTNGDYSLGTSAGFNTTLFKRVSLNESVRHITGNTSNEDTLSSTTSLSGAIGRNRLRFSADYNFLPDSELGRILATYSRDFSQKLKAEVGVSKRYQQSLTEFSAKLDWQAGFVRISPSITYNNKRDFFAGLNTRFGILRDPSTGRVKSYDHNITGFGGVSAFVFLDKDGDGLFNGTDEPLKDIVVQAPQNGGNVVTDENGIAMFTRMGKLRLTDVFVDPTSLQDPTWVTGFEGISVLPREGYIAEVNFPIHISGEIDGSVYALSVEPSVDEDNPEKTTSVALRNILLKIYDKDGKVAGTSFTDSSGFYYFSQIPPGRYLLIISEKSASRNKFVRPLPQEIEIGYDGTVIYGNNIYLETGTDDIPAEIKADLEDYKARHPHIDFSKEEHDLVLNLGQFNSRLLMSIVWYKIRSRYHSILSGGDLFVQPAKSFANVKTGKHILRVGLQDKTLEQAYDRCRALMAREQYCKVEIYPSYMKHAKAVVSNQDKTAK